MSKKHIKTTVNDVEHEILVDSTWTLLETLRDHLGLTGTKEGCSNGNCGACTVMIDDKSSCSCLVLAPEIDGLKVTTVEGLADHGHLSPVQDAFVEKAFQTLLGRDPDELEREECTIFIEEISQLLSKGKGTPSTTRIHARLIHALLNHNDFISIR